MTHSLNFKTLRDYKYIEGLLKHDGTILEDIYRKYSSRIEQMIISQGGTSEDAKDIFQDALMIIYRKAQKPDFQLTSQFFTYLFVICRNLWLKKIRKKGNLLVTIPDEMEYISEVNIEKEIIARERHKIYEYYFSKLNKNCQLLLEAFFEGKSMKEITSLFGFKNEHSARTQKYKCQKKLEKSIKTSQYFQEFSEGK